MSLGRRDFSAINRRQPDFISQMVKQKKNTYSDSLERDFGKEAGKFLSRVPCLAELDSIDQRKLLETAICHIKLPGETIFEAGSDWSALQLDQLICGLPGSYVWM
jgi:hypothetical protein